MSIRDIILSLSTQEPNKSRRKAGIVDGDFVPTDEGVKAVVSWWLNNSSDAVKFDEQIVKARIEEIEKQK